MKSYGVPLPRDPKTMEYEPSAPYPPLVMLTPSMTYWFSRPLAPETDGLALPRLPLLLTPGARYSVSLKRRPTGRVDRVAVSRFAPIVVWLALSRGAEPTTVTLSFSAPTSIVRGRSTV